MQSLFFLHSAPDDLENPDRLRSLLKDIREARQAKSREGLDQLDHNELTVSSLIGRNTRRPTTSTSYLTYVPWRSTKFDLSLSALWMFSRSYNRSKGLLPTSDRVCPIWQRRNIPLGLSPLPYRSNRGISFCPRNESPALRATSREIEPPPAARLGAPSCMCPRWLLVLCCAC